VDYFVLRQKDTKQTNAVMQVLDLIYNKKPSKTKPKNIFPFGEALKKGGSL
jgi:hypothetical protein